MPTLAPEARTLKLSVTVYLPRTSRLLNHDEGTEERALARYLTEHLNTHYLPAITSGARPVALVTECRKAEGGSR